MRETFERRPNHFPAIEDEAEAFAALLDPGDDLSGALKAWLKRELGIAVRVLPVATMPNWRRRYDRHSQRLFVSERLSPFDQLREIAMEACLIRMRVAIPAEIEALKLSSRRGAPARPLRARPLCRPCADDAVRGIPGRRAALRLRHRRAALALRRLLRAGGEPADHALPRPGSAGIPFFMLEVDHAGNRFRRAGAQGFPQGRFGGGCPKLPVHAAFDRPGPDPGRGGGDA